MATQRILWQWLDGSGHEFAQLSLQNGSWRIAGTALLAHEGRPCRLSYRLTCDASWQTQAAHVTGRLGGARVAVDLARDDAGDWLLNGQRCAEVAGCMDIDLNFSPVTNLLPIRRLALPIGQAAEVRAAWLRFPSFALEPLDQVYRRVGEHLYRYEAVASGFTADLTLNAAGFVTRYGDIWEAQAIGE